MTQDKPKAILLTPGEEYKDYSDFCLKENLPVASSEELYQGAYYLALRAILNGFGSEAMSSYLLASGSVSMILHRMDEKLFLLIFKTDDLEKYEADKPEEVGPIDHLG